ncbi:sodium/calcium exchanger NCL1-like [Abrus precatorius]|uniref:Sodium/calcium exchanger NCL1-like n=1 Tax=Abrus precatorius TaxID=3816 RepID=A0A8B8KGK1_ABRPR|nr:sodium/calcium exchanger NCL1-like [Abrus precatorius]
MSSEIVTVPPKSGTSSSPLTNDRLFLVLAFITGCDLICPATIFPCFLLGVNYLNHIAGSLEPKTLFKCIPPLLDQFKLNIDGGACLSADGASCGGLLVFIRCSHLVLPLRHNCGEFIGVLMLLSLGVSGYLLRKIKFVRLSHVLRENNQCDDWPAKHRSKDVFKVQGRYLPEHASELVSDGVHNVEHSKSSYLVIKGIDESFEDECKQMYGFLPCTNNIFGHLFLILVYEYLLFHGESYLANGGEQIFKILGPGIFGASAFHIIGALPESLILLVSGLVSSREIAQEYGFTGVGLLAGSSILLLTVVWGSCVIAGSQEFVHDSLRSNSVHRSLKVLLTGCGIVTDLETSYTARIMVFSVIPLAIMQIPTFFQFSSGPRSMTLVVALVISTIFLLLYFIYQIFEPWVQKRRLEYVKHDHLILRILEHVQKNTLQRILTKNGTPNVSAIRRLYREIDPEGSSGISAAKVKDLLLRNKVTETNMDEEKEIKEVLEIFDLDGDQKITREEFVSGFTKWLDQTKHALDKQYFSRKSLKEIYQVFGPWIENKRKEHEGKKQLISEILRHVQSEMVGNLLTADGKPNEYAIRRLFEKIDSNRDNCISHSELRELIMNIKFVKFSMEVEEAVALVIEELDLDKDRIINEEEFVAGFQKWLSSTSAPAIESDSESQEDIYQTWEEADMVVEEKQSKAVIDKSLWAWFKAITYVVLGIAMLSILAEPLIESVHNFSNSAGLHPFFISFILVPLATNAREATSAIKEAKHKKPRTISLAISEIYGGVFMNNILGFFALSVLIYVREITWEFSAELLVVAIVCAITGLTASFHSIFPLWSSFCAILLYPLSLVLVFVLDHVLNYN